MTTSNERLTTMKALLLALLSFGCLAGVAGVASSGAQGPAQAAPSATIYSSLPLQGDSRPQSVDIVRAMRLALEDHGGTAGGYRINYVSLDDASKEFGFWDPDRVMDNAHRAARDSNAIAYLGEFNSGASMFSIPILNAAGMLQVSPSNTYVGLTRAEGAEAGEPRRHYPTDTRHYGRVVPSDHAQAAAVVSYMRDKGCKNVYILHDMEVYGSGIANQVRRVARSRDFKILGKRAIDEGSWRRAARKVTRADADCFFHGGITMNGAVPVFRAVGGGSPTIKMFGPDGVAESAFTENLPPKLQKRTFITNPTLAPESYQPLGRKFFADFKAKYGRLPEPYAIYGYEAMSVALAAIDNAAGAATDAAGRQAVIDAFFRTKARRVGPRHLRHRRQRRHHSVRLRRLRGQEGRARVLEGHRHPPEPLTPRFQCA